MVLQEINHCLPDCPQLPVRSYKSKSRSWLWLRVYVPQQPSQAQSPRTVKAAAPFMQPCVYSCSLTGCSVISSRCIQWEITQSRASDRQQDTWQNDKSHAHGGKRWPGASTTSYTLLTQANTTPDARNGRCLPGDKPVKQSPGLH